MTTKKWKQSQNLSQTIRLLEQLAYTFQGLPDQSNDALWGSISDLLLILRILLRQYS